MPAERPTSSEMGSDEEEIQTEEAHLVMHRTGAFGSTRKSGTGFGDRKEERRSEWWLLQKDADSKSGGSLPSQPSVFLQPKWRQAKPGKGVFDTIVSIVFSRLLSLSRGKGNSKKNKVQDTKKAEEKHKTVIPDEDENEALDDPTTVLPKFPFLILNPRSLKMIVWEIWMLIMVVGALVLVPFRLAFETAQLRQREGLRNWAVYDSYLIYMEYFMDLFFLLDMFVCLRKAYLKLLPNGDYSLVVSQGRVMLHYLSTSFVLDIVCGVPWEFMYNLYLQIELGVDPQTVPPDSWERKIVVISRIPRILKLNKISAFFTLSRIGSLDRHIQAMRELIALRNGAVRIFKFLSTFLIALHWVACLLFYLGTMNKEFSGDDNLFEKSWITTVALVIKKCPDDQPCQSGRVLIGSKQTPISAQYLMSVYWVTTTMTQVGYGDLTPVTQYEVISLAFGMIVGASIFSYIIGNATQLIDEVQGNDGIVSEELDRVSRFMVEAELPKALRMRVINYFTRQMKSPMRAIPLVVDGLPDALAAELKLRIWHKALYTQSPENPLNVKLVPLLAGLSSNVLAKVVQKLEVVDVVPGEIIFNFGDASKSVAFIWSGELELLDPTDSQVLGTVLPGGLCGENSLVKGEEKNLCSIRARGWCNILMMHLKDLEDAFVGQDEDAHWMITYAQRRWGRFRAAVQMSRVVQEAMRTMQHVGQGVGREQIMGEVAHFADRDLEERKRAFGERGLEKRRQEIRAAALERDGQRKQGRAPGFRRMSSILKQPADLSRNSSAASGSASQPEEQVDGGQTANVGPTLEDTLLDLLFLSCDGVYKHVVALRDIARRFKENPAFCMSRDWLDSATLVEEAEAEHEDAFPSSKVTVHCVGAEGLSSTFAGLIHGSNPFCRVTLVGTSYETLVVENNLNPEWNEKFIWKADYAIDHAEIRAFVLDYTDQVHNPLMGMCDIPLTHLAEDEWVDESYDLLNRHSDKAGTLHLRILYSPKKKRRVPAPRIVKDLMQAEHEHTKLRLVQLVRRISERLLTLEERMGTYKSESKARVREACKELLMQHRELIDKSTKKHVMALLKSANDGLVDDMGLEDSDLEEETPSEKGGAHQQQRWTAFREKKSGWRKVKSRTTGKVFWYNKYTKETRTKDPYADDTPPKPSQEDTKPDQKPTWLLQDLPPGWVQRLSRRKGLVFFQEILSGATSWVPPRPALPHQLVAELLGVFRPSMFHPDGRPALSVSRSIIPIRVPSTAAGFGDAGQAAGVQLPGQVPVGAEGGAEVGGGAADGSVVREWIEDLSGLHGVWKEPGEEARLLRRTMSFDNVRAVIHYEAHDSRVVYRGEMRSGRRHGLGVIQFRDGVSYFGQWLNDQPEGCGEEVYPNKFMYQGEFVADRRHGLGVIKSENVAYWGHWFRGRRDGRGVERMMLKGDPLDCVTTCESGEVVSREPATVEHRSVALLLRDSATAQASRAALYAEAARAVADHVRQLEEKNPPAHAGPVIQVRGEYTAEQAVSSAPPMSFSFGEMARIRSGESFAATNASSPPPAGV